MPEPRQDSPSLTEQLRHFSGGDREIAEAVLRQVLPELHRVAVRELGREQQAPAITPTELINELWLRSLRKGGWKINNREHFYAIAALAMREVLIDSARIRSAQKRGYGTLPASLNGFSAPVTVPENVDPESLVQIGILMDQLQKQNPLRARIVDMHYFAGFTLEEIAEIIGLTFRQVRSQWERGRDFLKDGLRK